MNTLSLLALVGAGLLLSNGTAAGQATSSTTVHAPGYCLSFDGVDDCVHVLHTPSLEPSEITVELWARLDGPQDWNTRLLRKGEHDAYFITADQDNDQRMQLLVTRGTQFRVQAKDTLPNTVYIGTWHHFLGIYAADHAEFWVDGVQKAYVTHDLGALTHQPLTDLYIGCGLPVTLQNEYFAGRIDEVRIWNYVRTPADIAATWNRTLLGTESGLVAYWRFDEGSGQVAHDSSPYGNDGELGSSPNAESSDPAWVISDAPILPGPCAVGRYCVGAINTTGHAARIDWNGSADIAENDLVLVANGCPPNHFGIFFFGTYQTQIPFGEGYLCVTGNQHRLTPIQTDANGACLYPLDFSDASNKESIISPASEWNFQFWYRDPQPVGHGFNFTDALDVHFCP